MGPSGRRRSRWWAIPCTERGPRRVLLGVRGLALLLLLFAITDCQHALSPGAETARAWAEGPARWLLLPDEEEAVQAVRSQVEFTAFLQAFWARRDEDPAREGNDFAQRFALRVGDADRLYTEEGVRGSLTDRGGALILLGPPSILRSAQRKAPTWQGAASSGEARPTKLVRVEIWSYGTPDLSPRLIERLGLDDGVLTLTFLVGNKSTRLIEGKDALEEAARAAVPDLATTPPPTP